MSRAIVSDIVVVDTDVVSFFFKGDTRASLYQPHLDGRLRIIAAQTRAELERWTLARNWGERRRAALRSFLKDFLFVEADETVCLRWAEVKDVGDRRGRPISSVDAWIAATALAYDVTLVTHNRKDFENVPGLLVISEN
ncbi:MAG: PIN domain-containing protein [Acidobacteria bacterium]|nr:PIN domain-containing protein [Acidobacteriota bacterium]MCA1641153.1 PIN domain-containing protein [Acidobacteriota bacterium]